MKVTAFVGSPRVGGNADTLADAFLDGAKRAGSNIAKIFLNTCSINQCRGCFRACTTRSGIACAVHRDDMDMLLHELTASDCVLFSSPLYCAGPSSIMMRFFERCLPLWQIEVTGEMGTTDSIRFINNPARGIKAVIGLVQDLRDPETGKLGLQVFKHIVGGSYMMNIVEILHMTDVRDIGDLKKKKEHLRTISETARALCL